MSQQENPEITLEWDVADRLRKSLRGSGVSVQEMADTLECSRNTVGNYINGRTSPDYPALRLWAMRTGYPIGWLRDGIEPTGTDPDGATSPHVTSGNDVLNATRTAQVIEVRFGHDELPVAV